MHEFSIIDQVLKTVEYVAKKNNLSRVTKIVLQIGRLRQVMPDFLQFAFEAASNETIAKDAKLELKVIPIKIQCLKCDNLFNVSKNTYICPACKAHQIKVVSGKEIIIESIEGDKNAN